MEDEKFIQIVSNHENKYNSAELVGLTNEGNLFVWSFDDSHSAWEKFDLPDFESFDSMDEDE